MKILEFAGDTIEGEDFAKFLSVCASRSTHFSLAKYVFSDVSPVPTAFESLLEPYVFKSFRPTRWFGYPQVNGQYLTETVYKICPESVEILGKHCRDLFLKKGAKKLGRREDLCFWDNGTMVLGTLSHECICATNRITDRFAEELFPLGQWRKTEKPGFFIEDATFG